MRSSGGAYLADRGLLVYGSHYDALKRQIAPQAKVTILVEEPPDYAAVLKDIRDNKFGAGAIAVFDRSADPDPALLTLDDKIDKVHLLYNVPSTFGEAVIVHDSESEEVLQQYLPIFHSVERNLQSLGGIKIAPSSGKTARDWLRDYVLTTAKPTDLVLVVSHVEERLELDRRADFLTPVWKNVLPLIDQSQFSPADDIGGPSRPLLWTIGCDTWDVLSTGKGVSTPQLSFSEQLEYRQSVDIARRLLGNTTTARAMIANAQSFEVPHVPNSRITPPNTTIPHTKGGHFSDEKPTTKLQLIVELTNTKGIITTTTGVA